MAPIVGTCNKKPTAAKSKTAPSIGKVPLQKKDAKPQKENTTDNVKKVPVKSTPKKPKEKLVQANSVKSVTKSSWKRRPKPAHSGVPVPEKMKMLLLKKTIFQIDDSL